MIDGDYLVDAWWEVLFRSSVSAAIAFPSAMLVCYFFQRLPRRMHCWVWRIAYAKVLISAVGLTPLEIPILPVNDRGVDEKTPIVRRSSKESVYRFSVAQAREQVQPLTAWRNWRHSFFIVWSIGAGMALVRLCNEWVASRRIRRSAALCHRDLVYDQLRDAADSLCLLRLPGVRISNAVNSPVLVGIRRPTVILPAWLLDRISSRELFLVLKHELGHQKRYDLVWNILPRLVGATLFFHPFVWIASRRWRVTQESACDELVLRSEDVHVKSYAEMLLRIAELLGATSKPARIGLGALGSRSSLRERLIIMQNMKRWDRTHSRTVVFVFILIGFVVLFPWQLAAQPSTLRFLNGSFERGDSTGWVVKAGPNATYQFFEVAPRSDRWERSATNSNALSISVGQLTSEQNQYRHVDVTQAIRLKRGCRYEFSFEWAVENTYPIDNFDGGVFQLIVDGEVIATFNSQSVFAESFESGVVSGTFAPPRTDRFMVGARISRRYPIPFPEMQHPALRQCLDSFSIRQVDID